MRTALFTIAAAASALVVASPASAQYFPVPPAPPGYAYGHNNFGFNNLGHTRVLKVRIDRMQREIRRLAHYRMISPREHNQLLRESREIERRLIRDSRDGYGLTRREAFGIERRIVRLEQRIARDVRDGRRYRRW